MDLSRFCASLRLTPQRTRRTRPMERRQKGERMDRGLIESFVIGKHRRSIGVLDSLDEPANFLRLLPMGHRTYGPNWQFQTAFLAILDRTYGVEWQPFGVLNGG